MTFETGGERSQEAAALTAARGGDQAAFTALAERYRGQLRVHCYRMLGSFDDAEDMVQETMLRAWRSREAFEGRSLFRTWLYRIATNACLNAIERAPPRLLPVDLVAPVTAAATEPTDSPPSQPPIAPEIPWLQPYPDAQLETVATERTGPEATVEARETIELAFVAALQHLPGRQRAILILAEVVGWSAREIAAMLELSVPAVTSALQRAHTTLRARLPPDRQGRQQNWRQKGAPSAAITDEQRAVLQRFMSAWEQNDPAALTSLLREDARWSMPPAPLWFEGRAAIANMLRLFPPGWRGRQFKLIATGANRQPAAAAYLRESGEQRYRLSGVLVLRIEGGSIADITTFGPALCARFGLPETRD